MKVAFFGSSLVSAYWNGAATYYRGLVRALHARGFRTTFYEPDAYERQAHRDIDDPEWAEVYVYPATEAGVSRALEHARNADLVVKASGVGVFDAFLEESVLSFRSARTAVAFWDVDAPATLARLDGDGADPFHALIPRYDLVFTYGGGPPVVAAYERRGARACVPIYNALDPETHHPVPPEARFSGALAFLGNRLPDREARVDDFFLQAARLLDGETFVLGGSGWGDRALPANVRYVGHVYTRDHNAFNCTPRAVLNISRESMAKMGFSPATRVFEAAGAGACLVTDSWEGIETFFEPGEEILVARDGEDVARAVRGLREETARAIGARALSRVLAEHTYAHRARDVEAALAAAPPRPRSQPVLRRAPATSHDRDDERTSKPRPLNIVILGLSITSSWGNGHATTYRGLVRELTRRGHRVLFLERDVPWYAAERDLPAAGYGRTELYEDVPDLKSRFVRDVADADLVVVGSYVPEGVAVGAWVQRVARGVTAFYDIDTPVTLAELRAGRCDYVSRALVPAYEMYLSFTGGPTLERLRDEFGARRTHPLYCSVDPELYFPTNEPHAWDLGYMGTYSADRQPAIERLLLEPARRSPSSRFVVAGPQYPGGIVWPENVTRAEHVAPHAHRSFYARQRFTLNVTRRAMIKAGYSPSVRLFEAAACATPIISDRWNGLSTIFEEGKEVLVATKPEQVLELLHDLPRAERFAIGRRSRLRVLAEHTAAHRARELEGYVNDVLGEGRAEVRSA